MRSAEPAPASRRRWSVPKPTAPKPQPPRALLRDTQRIHDDIQCEHAQDREAGTADPPPMCVAGPRRSSHPRRRPSQRSLARRHTPLHRRPARAHRRSPATSRYGGHHGTSALRDSIGCGSARSGYSSSITSASCSRRGTITSRPRTRSNGLTWPMQLLNPWRLGLLFLISGVASRFAAREARIGAGPSPAIAHGATAGAGDLLIGHRALGHAAGVGAVARDGRATRTIFLYFWTARLFRVRAERLRDPRLQAGLDPADVEPPLVRRLPVALHASGGGRCRADRPIAPLQRAFDRLFGRLAAVCAAADGAVDGPNRALSQSGGEPRARRRLDRAPDLRAAVPIRHGAGALARAARACGAGLAMAARGRNRGLRGADGDQHMVRRCAADAAALHLARAAGPLGSDVGHDPGTGRIGDRASEPATHPFAIGSRRRSSLFTSRIRPY